MPPKTGAASANVGAGWHATQEKQVKEKQKFKEGFRRGELIRNADLGPMRARIMRLSELESRGQLDGVLRKRLTELREFVLEAEKTRGLADEVEENGRKSGSGAGGSGAGKVGASAKGRIGHPPSGSSEAELRRKYPRPHLSPFFHPTFNPFGVPPPGLEHMLPRECLAPDPATLPRPPTNSAAGDARKRHREPAGPAPGAPDEPEEVKRRRVRAIRLQQRPLTVHDPLGAFIPPIPDSPPPRPPLPTDPPPDLVALPEARSKQQFTQQTSVLEDLLGGYDEVAPRRSGASSEAIGADSGVAEAAYPDAPDYTEYPEAPDAEYPEVPDYEEYPEVPEYADYPEAPGDPASGGEETYPEVPADPLVEEAGAYPEAPAVDDAAMVEGSDPARSPEKKVGMIPSALRRRR
jgi:hypothetical protein